MGSEVDGQLEPICFSTTAEADISPINSVCVCACVCVVCACMCCVCMYVFVCSMHGGQRVAFRSQFSFQRMGPRD